MIHTVGVFDEGEDKVDKGGGRKEEEGDVRGEVKRRVDEIKFEKMGTVCRQ